MADGKTVGTTRRCAFSPAVNRAIAMALIDRTYTGTGQKLIVENPAGPTPVSVTPLPFLDPEGKRVRG
jgi:glycine cleavage system aminomethyltransferase T